MTAGQNSSRHKNARAPAITAHSTWQTKKTKKQKKVNVCSAPLPTLLKEMLTNIHSFIIWNHKDEWEGREREREVASRIETASVFLSSGQMETTRLVFLFPTGCLSDSVKVLIAPLQREGEGLGICESYHLSCTHWSFLWCHQPHFSLGPFTKKTAEKNLHVAASIKLKQNISHKRPV